jgi:hypothetical protein
VPYAALHACLVPLERDDRERLARIEHMLEHRRRVGVKKRYAASDSLRRDIDLRRGRGMFCEGRSRGPVAARVADDQL